MYIKHQMPDAEIAMASGAVFHPIITLSNQYNNKIHIIINDHCYVCLIQKENEAYTRTAWWPKEVDNALASYISEEEYNG